MIKEEVTPIWMKYVIGILTAGILTLLTWLSFAVHEQDGKIEEGLGRLAVRFEQVLGEMKSQTTLSDAMLASRVELLTSGLMNIKEVAIEKCNVTDQRARDRKVVVNRRLKEIEELIEKHHRVNR